MSKAESEPTSEGEGEADYHSADEAGSGDENGSPRLKPRQRASDDEDGDEASSELFQSALETQKSPSPDDAKIEEKINTMGISAKESDSLASTTIKESPSEEAKINVKLENSNGTQDHKDSTDSEEIQDDVASIPVITASAGHVDEISVSDSKQSIAEQNDDDGQPLEAKNEIAQQNLPNEKPAEEVQGETSDHKSIIPEETSNHEPNASEETSTVIEAKAEKQTPEQKPESEAAPPAAKNTPVPSTKYQSEVAMENEESDDEVDHRKLLQARLGASDDEDATESDKESEAANEKPAGRPPNTDLELPAPGEAEEDRKNPAFVPKKGVFYQHDMRAADDASDAAKMSKKSEWITKNQWRHDMFQDTDQAPKSREELIHSYGYDIRGEERAPHGLQQRKYSRQKPAPRDWRDPDTYNRHGAGTRRHDKEPPDGPVRSLSHEDAAPDYHDQEAFPSLEPAADYPLESRPNQFKRGGSERPGRYGTENSSNEWFNNEPGSGGGRPFRKGINEPAAGPPQRGGGFRANARGGDRPPPNRGFETRGGRGGSGRRRGGDYGDHRPPWGQTGYEAFEERRAEPASYVRNEYAGNRRGEDFSRKSFPAMEFRRRQPNRGELREPPPPRARGRGGRGSYRADIPPRHQDVPPRFKNRNNNRGGLDARQREGAPDAAGGRGDYEEYNRSTAPEGAHNETFDTECSEEQSNARSGAVPSVHAAPFIPRHMQQNAPRENERNTGIRRYSAMRQAKNPQPFSQQQGFQSGGSVPAVQQNPNVPQMNYYDGYQVNYDPRLLQQMQMQQSADYDMMYAAAVASNQDPSYVIPQMAQNYPGDLSPAFYPQSGNAYVSGASFQHQQQFDSDYRQGNETATGGGQRRAKAREKAIPIVDPASARNRPPREASPPDEPNPRS